MCQYEISHDKSFETILSRCRHVFGVFLPFLLLRDASSLYFYRTTRTGNMKYNQVYIFSILL